MKLKDYLSEHLESVVLVTLSVDNSDPIGYNNWNWIDKESELHLLGEDYTIRHILYNEDIVLSDDGSISYVSNYYPKNCVLNFYFGKALN